MGLTGPSRTVTVPEPMELPDPEPIELPEEAPVEEPTPAPVEPEKVPA